MTASRATDLREAGSWTRGQALKNDLLFVVITCALAALGLLPARALRAIGKGFGLVVFALVPHLRRTAQRNVARALPDLHPDARRAIVRRSYVRLGGHLGEAVAALDPRRRLPLLAIDDASLALLTNARAGPGGAVRGILFASAHLGPWERVAATLVAKGVAMTVLAREPYDPRLSFIYDRLRGGRAEGSPDGRGVAAIYRGHAGAPARIVRTLRAGGVLGVPMDLHSRVPSVGAPFLGGEARVPIGPARIALRMGAAVVVGTVAADGATGGLRITCTEIPTADLLPRAGARATDGANDVAERELTARLASELSRRIQALPEEWVWMHDRFPGNPVD